MLPSSVSSSTRLSEYLQAARQTRGDNMAVTVIAMVAIIAIVAIIITSITAPDDNTLDDTLNKTHEEDNNHDNSNNRHQ